MPGLFPLVSASLALLFLVGCEVGAHGSAGPVEGVVNRWTPVAEVSGGPTEAERDGPAGWVLPTTRVAFRVDVSPPDPPRRFRGRPIDLNVKNADLHALFRFLSDVGGANIVVSDEVKGAVTLRLRSVPWDEAMYVVARAKRLHLERKGNVWFVLP